MKGHYEKAIGMEECLFAFIMDEYYSKKIIEFMGLLVDEGATSHISRDSKKFKIYNQTFQPENHYMELADGTKASSVRLKRGDTELCLLDADQNHVLVTLKKALLIPSYSHDIFSVKVTTISEVTVIFKENKKQLRHKSGTKFKICIHKRLYNL